MSSSDDARQEPPLAAARFRAGPPFSEGADPGAEVDASERAGRSSSPTPAPFRTELLVDHPELFATLEAWFVAEWPDFYGTDGVGDAAHDVRSYARRSELPVGLVGFSGDEVVAFAAVKAQALTTRPDLGPWIVAGMVLPPHQRRGFGARFLSAIEQVASGLGCAQLYCATASAALVVERCGWGYVDVSECQGVDVAIYKRSLR